MRDVEACHIICLLEFMYAGQVNVAQANLSTFLKTAESLKIRGLTDTSESFPNQESDDSNPQQYKISTEPEKLHISTNNVSSSQDVLGVPTISSPPPKKTKTETDISSQEDNNEKNEHGDIQDSVELVNHSWQPKDELPDYLSDIDEGDKEVNEMLSKLPAVGDFTKISSEPTI